MPYLDLPGDALQAAASFPAAVKFSQMLRGGGGDDSLDGLAWRADRTVELIGRILRGQELWRYQAEDS